MPASKNEVTAVRPPEPFEVLVAPLLKRAYGMAYAMTHCREDAQDMVQEAAVQAFCSYGTFQAETNFKAWFFKILTRVLIRNYRKNQRQPPAGSMEDTPELFLYNQMRAAGWNTHGSDPAALLLRRLDAQQVATALAALPPEYRVVAGLYFLENLSYHEIARSVGCPLGTVRSRLHRGRRLLQKALWQVAQERGLLGDLDEGDLGEPEG